MHKAERVVIYAGLALAIGLGLGWQGLSGTANANASRAAAPVPATIATCDVLLLVDKALMSERYFPIRDSKAKELNARLEPLGKELLAVEGPLQQIADRTSPEFRTAYEAWVPKKKAFDQARQELTKEFDEYNTAQAVEAYKLICDAAAAFAKNNGYSHVIATRSSLELKSKQSGGVVQEANSRPVVFGPTTDDITEALAKELKIDVPAPGAIPAEKNPNDPPVPADAAEKAKEEARKKAEQDAAAKKEGGK